MLGITGLQLYWNYQNYQTTVSSFKKDANNALNVAVDREMANRRERLYLKVKSWLADTAIVKVTCDTNNKERNTAFTMEDVVPYYPDEKASKVTIGISSYKEKIGKITPEAKAVFVEHFAKIIKDDLNDGTTHYYTQGLGHRIEREFESNKVDKKTLIKFYRNELQNRKIYSMVTLNPKHLQIKNHFITNRVNTSFRSPYDQELVWASLENPSHYYLREMKWLIVSSFLLIGITLLCFYYTISTLFNQYKLVAIKNQFISNMTHEINTPLSSIQVTTEALQKFDLNKETTKKYLDIILYQTNKLNQLSGEILDHAKLETLSFPMNEKINLNELIIRVINDFKLTAPHVFKYVNDDEAAIIKGNTAHLSRSIANVLENAIKYNDATEPMVHIKLYRTNKGLNLSIADNGPGIADAYKDKIFEQFYRIPTGNIHDTKGYGLGLSYVKKVVVQHHGTIDVFDNQPNGSLFSINLPC